MSSFTSKNNTPVFTVEEAHPHRLDLAAEAIAKMVVPAAPADPSDRNQTRICETVDLGRVIGKNHLVQIDSGDLTFMWDRGRGYMSHMVLKEAEDETRLTTVLFWDADKTRWVFWTNFEGIEGLPEPGCDRYNKASDEFKRECWEFWQAHALVPTKEEKEAIESHVGWIFNTSEDETICNNRYDRFKDCIADYNTAKKYEEKEAWIVVLSKPFAI